MPTHGDCSLEELVHVGCEWLVERVGGGVGVQDEERVLRETEYALVSHRHSKKSRISEQEGCC